ncbi:NifU-like N terminal domain-containing protein [Limtongia smithiae]|uniref:NifU-like N terminal domain-containing protein n=1 Tax=Limtongia smithiae TaxID=1125753 RepID=UPI0034CEE19B
MNALTRQLRPIILAAPSRAAATPVVAFARGYHAKVLDHYNKPRNVGSMDKNDLDVGTGLVGAPACGDVMKLQIRVDDNGIISDVKFKTFGCGSAIASSSYLTELVRGMSLDEAGKVKNTTIAKELSLPPVKLHCSMLAEDAIKSAIKDYRSKSRRAPQPTVLRNTASIAIETPMSASASAPKSA